MNVRILRRVGGGDLIWEDLHGKSAKISDKEFIF